MYYLILSFCLSCFPSLATNDPAPLTPTAKRWLRVTRRLSRDYKYVLKASYEKVYVSFRRRRENVHIGSCWQKRGWKIMKRINPQSLGSSLRIGPPAVVVSPSCSRGETCILLQQMVSLTFCIAAFFSSSERGHHGLVTEMSRDHKWRGAIRHSRVSAPAATSADTTAS